MVIFRLSALLSLLTCWIYLIPALEQFGMVFSYARQLLWGEPAVGRTLIFAALSALISSILGFISAVRLRHIRPNTIIGSSLALLLAPILLGDIGVGLLLKINFMGSPLLSDALSNRPNHAMLVALVSIQVWQLWPFFTYLFWLRIRALPSSLLDFEAIGRLSAFEAMRDLLWPHCRTQAMLLIPMGFLLSCHEFSKSHLVFRLSPGTDTSLIAHWLYQEYLSNLVVGVGLARDSALRSSAAIFVILWLAALSITLISDTSLTALSKLLYRRAKSLLGAKLSAHRPARPILAWLLVTLVTLPIARALFLVPPSAPGGYYKIAQALGFALASGIISALMATALSIGLIVGFSRILNSFRGGFAFIVLSILSLQAFPSLALGLCGYSWFGTTIEHGHFVAITFWFIGQAILSLPWLGAFMLWTHSRVSVRELEFQELAGVRGWGLVRASFLLRFGLDYVLLTLFSWSLTWNESALNRAFSDIVPTLIDILGPKVGGRPNYAQGLGVVIISAFFCLFSIILWNSILKKTRSI